jgi:hypothetical protein
MGLGSASSYEVTLRPTRRAGQVQLARPTDHLQDTTANHDTWIITADPGRCRQPTRLLKRLLSPDLCAASGDEVADTKEELENGHHNG